MKRYYSLYQNIENKTADIYIYGDITSWAWDESDVSSYTLSKELQELGDDIENINVYINSYGGEVAEGLAIHNALKRHKANVTTITDGFACSIATVVFAAGDERVIYTTGLAFYHNAWTYTAGNANDLRKEADDLEKITQASIKAYKTASNLSEEELKSLLDNDTWLNAEEMLEKGFATKIVEADSKQVATQSVRKSLMQKITEEPKNVVVTNVQLNADELSEKIIQKIKEQFKEEEPTINKPLNMMRALFNLREE